MTRKFSKKKQHNIQIAIVTSHPIQYYAPWFRHLAQSTDIEIKVFYLWDFGVTQQVDAGFKQLVQWDIPLLDGYSYEFVPNVSSNPGTHHFWGLQNPTLIDRVKAYQPDAVLLMCYNYASTYRLIWNWDTRQAPLLFRGDSHRLIPGSGINSLVKRLFISQIFRRFSAVLYVGTANYQYFRYHHVAEDLLFFAPHAVDNERFFAQTEIANQQAQLWKQELGIPATNRVILFAGKFEVIKRPIDLVQAFLQANLEQVSLLFIGAGTLEAELQAATAQHNNIYVAPFQNQTLMPRTYAISDLIVLPSDSETWGLAINEAMCMARPAIVSSHVGCAQDLIEPGINGLVFPAGDITALANCLQQAFVDRFQLSCWGIASQQKIQQYSYIQTSQGLVNALKYLKLEINKIPESKKT
jgi:glycosyltransferase involved in cell wall biosynthesis